MPLAPSNGAEIIFEKGLNNSDITFEIFCATMDERADVKKNPEQKFCDRENPTERNIAIYEGLPLILTSEGIAENLSINNDDPSNNEEYMSTVFFYTLDLESMCGSLKRYITCDETVALVKKQIKSTFFFIENTKTHQHYFFLLPHGGSLSDIDTLKHAALTSEISILDSSIPYMQLKKKYIEKYGKPHISENKGHDKNFILLFDQWLDKKNASALILMHTKVKGGINYSYEDRIITSVEREWLIVDKILSAPVLVKALKALRNRVSEQAKSKRKNADAQREKEIDNAVK